MPLSEHEQRILADIEAGLREDDPRFADAVAKRTTTTWRHRMRWIVVAFVVGFALLFVGLNVHILWGVAGFGLMLVAAYQGLMVAKKLAETRPSSEATAAAGPLQRYLDAARRRDDEDS